MGLTKKFNRCVKNVVKKLPESAAIAICTKSVLHSRGRTIKKYTRRRLITQKKKGGREDLDMKLLIDTIHEAGCNVHEPPRKEDADECQQVILDRMDQVAKETDNGKDNPEDMDVIMQLIRENPEYGRLSQLLDQLYYLKLKCFP